MPELQGEPEEISKEKARLAAKEVFFLKKIYCSVYCLETKDGNVCMASGGWWAVNFPLKIFVGKIRVLKGKLYQLQHM